MPASPVSVADEIIYRMRSQNIDCATIPWDRFYRLCERKRIKEAFLVRLENELLKRSFLFVQGHAVVSIAKDFNFAELEF